MTDAAVEEATARWTARLESISASDAPIVDCWYAAPGQHGQICVCGGSGKFGKEEAIEDVLWTLEALSK